MPKTTIALDGKVMLLPLRPEPEQKPEQKPDTEHPSLPFIREIELEDEVVKLLGELSWHIPAIKHVREVMGWGLQESKAYVDHIYLKHLDKIGAARVKYLKSWRR